MLVKRVRKTFHKLNSHETSGWFNQTWSALVEGRHSPFHMCAHIYFHKLFMLEFTEYIIAVHVGGAKLNKAFSIIIFFSLLSVEMVF